MGLGAFLIAMTFRPFPKAQTGAADGGGGVEAGQNVAPVFRPSTSTLPLALSPPGR